MKLYKFLTAEGRGSHSEFDYSEYLPKRGKPGKWLPKVAELVECRSGYHSCKATNVAEWCNARMFEVEYRGNVEQGDNKVNGHEMRFVREMPGWNEKNARLAACDIAERIAMKVWNKHYPDDNRPQNCINTARKYAHGKASKSELDAAGDATWAAAWVAARDAAGDATRAATWAAAWAAAGAAARAAAWDATWDAAGDAARAATWAAARAAAGDATWDAAGAAARDATWDAANKIIMKYAKGKP